MSSARTRFVLKGAMLLRLWSDRPYRATRDLDLLRAGDGSFAAIRADIEAICSTKVEPDAIEFEPATLRIDPIRAEDEYAGTRAHLPARCGKALVTLQIDMGLARSLHEKAYDHNPGFRRSSRRAGSPSVRTRTF